MNFFFHYFSTRQQDFYDQYSSSYSDSHYWYGGMYGSNSNLYDYYGSTPVEIPQFQHPSHSLLQQNGFTQQVYLKYKQQCLDGKLKKKSRIYYRLTCFHRTN